jgi:hypothetical protein
MASRAAVVPEVFLGDYIRKLRGSRSRETVCRDANIDPTTLRRAEVMGHLTLLTATKLAPVLKVKPTDLKPRDGRAEWREAQRKLKPRKQGRIAPVMLERTDGRRNATAE